MAVPMCWISAEDAQARPGDEVKVFGAAVHPLVLKVLSVIPDRIFADRVIVQGRDEYHTWRTVDARIR